MDTTTRPLIMIINDDSVEAPGIHHLAECVADVADIYIVAPRNPHSGQSAALTVGAPLRIAELAGRDGLRVFTVNGTPVDCAASVCTLLFHAVPTLCFPESTTVQIRELP